MKKSEIVFNNTDHIQLVPHPEHHRIHRVVLSDDIISKFIAISAEEILQDLEYTPFARLMIAKQLGEILGEPFVQTLRAILHDRNSGCLTVSLQNITTDSDDYIKFATALTHLIGIPNFDAMTGNYYAQFVVEDNDDSDSYLRKAYRRMLLHTDGTYVNEPTDWLLMMKIAERNASGGRSRLLHLDDWESLDKFSQHPLASYPFTYKAPPSKNVNQTISRTTFYEGEDSKPCLCFIDQFAYPETREQASYLHDLSDAMENSAATKHVSLSPGELVLLNNHFWAHGRESFEKNTGLYRELVRLRGHFSET